jgi:hypothetical protein
MNFLNIILILVLVYIFFILFMRFILPWIIVFIARRLQNRINKTFEESRGQAYGDDIRIHPPEKKEKKDKKEKEFGDYVDFEEIPPSSE